MNDFRPPDALSLGITREVCRDTVSGWLWYCDVHDTHGNADSQDEAQHMADAHRDYFWDPEDEEYEEGCAIEIWMRTEHERT